MLSTRFAFATLVSLSLVCLLLPEAEGMGLCFGGYPACCSKGRNTCGPFCASCSRVGEFLRNMNMFEMMGFGKGTPMVFRIINPDPHSQPNKVPFPAKPFPVPKKKREASAPTSLQAPQF